MTRLQWGEVPPESQNDDRLHTLGTQSVKARVAYGTMTRGAQRASASVTPYCAIRRAFVVEEGKEGWEDSLWAQSIIYTLSSGKWPVSSLAEAADIRSPRPKPAPIVLATGAPLICEGPSVPSSRRAR